ncbi:MAG TPA: tetratricopeptide repeat protein, partial [Anaerolineae bacterium]|nr:tetratricopeptide repeat protein [Anaerolineae bacterium]
MSSQTHINGDLVQGDKVDGDKVLGDKHEHHYQSPQFPLDNLPPANPHFTGRRERLAAIQTAFQNPQNPVAITQTITGLGGVGKTQLALAYAHEQRDAYDLIWLLQADDPAALDGGLRRLGAALRLPVQNADAPTARQIVLSWLNGGHARWLLLYDNVDAIKPGDLRPWLPGGRGHVLITSRQPRWPQAQMVPLDVFTPEEAAAFWQRRLVQSGRLNQSAETALAALAEELGYLPLALEQAAAYMAARQKSAAAYLRLYRQRRRELWARAEPPDAYHATIMTTWQMAFDHARQTPGAADLLNLCCFLAPDDIPLEVITAHTDALPAELAAALGDELARDDALAALAAYSLAAKEDGLLTMHRLVQTVARDRMGEERAKVWAKAAVDLLYEAYNFDPHDMETWDACGQLLPHIRAAVNLADEWGVAINRTAYLNNAAGFYLQHYGSLEEARPYCEQALAICQKVLGPDHPHTAASLNNMGYLLRAMGRPEEARRYYEDALAICQKVLGPEHPDTASSLNNMGYLLQAMGRP